MAVPDFQSLMLPLLRLAADGRVHSLAEARDALATQFKLSDTDLQELLLPSGRQQKFANRVAWAVFIATSAFSAEATAYTDNIDPKVVLIDGRRLAELMIDFGVGVTTVASYEVKRIDSTTSTKLALRRATGLNSD
jgi:restriction endonuclease Mrr